METSLPTFYIPHGGGPCFFMASPDGGPSIWDPMAIWLRQLPQAVGVTPKAIVVISGHWEANAFTVTSSSQPELIYDYYGFPAATYQLTYPAPGAPALANQIDALIAAAGLPHSRDSKRGLDHGVFIPFKLIYPEATIPIVQLSLHTGLDSATHLAMGRALAPLRQQGVLIVGSGMSYHNMRGFSGAGRQASESFDTWLTAAVEAGSAKDRAHALQQWATAPGGRDSHPREEHLLPLMVAAGAAGADLGHKTFSGDLSGIKVAGFQFGAKALF